MTKKFLALTMVLILAAGFAAFANQPEQPLTMETSVSGIALSSSFLGDDGEIGSVYGTSLKYTTLEDHLSFRGTMAMGPTRVTEGYRVDFEQTDLLLQGKALLDIDVLEVDDVEIELRPGMVLGSKTVFTKITQSWYRNNRVNRETSSTPFWGPTVEVGLELDLSKEYPSYLSVNVGAEKINYESCGRNKWSPMTYASIGFGADF